MAVSSHQEHDDAVHPEHETALARGEQRVLYLTEHGMLHQSGIGRPTERKFTVVAEPARTPVPVADALPHDVPLHHSSG